MSQASLSSRSQPTHLSCPQSSSCRPSDSQLPAHLAYTASCRYSSCSFNAATACWEEAVNYYNYVSIVIGAFPPFSAFTICL